MMAKKYFLLGALFASITSCASGVIPELTTDADQPTDFGVEPSTTADLGTSTVCQEPYSAKTMSVELCTKLEQIYNNRADKMTDIACAGNINGVTVSGLFKFDYFNPDSVTQKAEGVIRCTTTISSGPSVPTRGMIMLVDGYTPGASANLNAQVIHLSWLAATPNSGSLTCVATTPQ
jgi:hypothetical protein